MVSREFIYSKIKSHHAISVHMRGKKRLDGLTSDIYVITELILDKEEEKQLLMNLSKKENSSGKLKVKAIRTSEVDASSDDSEPQEYVLNTSDIESFGCIFKK